MAQDGAAAAALGARSTGLSVYGLLFLVEDSRTQARYISTQLGYFGFQVETFERTDDALKALSQYTPAVVLTDISFPEGMDAGLRAVPAIKQSSKEPPFVVCLTTLTDFETRMKAVQVGVDGYYVKPANISHLVEHLDRLIRPRNDDPLRVLIVDHKPAMAEANAKQLAGVGMAPTILTQPRKLLDVMAEVQPDVLLCEMQLPGISGFELAGVMRQVDANAGIPIVFLSRDFTTGPIQSEMLASGGDAVLNKAMDAPAIASVVLAHGQRSRAISRHLLRDSMTGLLKHAALKEAIARELQRMRRSGGMLCYAMIDIDRFKSVNDTYGHAVGDRVIIALARVLAQNLRKGDVVGRYGGEEFGVILPETTPDEGMALMNELRLRFAQVNHIAGQSLFNATFSCGLAHYPRWLEVGSLVEHADAALYEAKRSGRNRVCISE